ncbi:MAG: dynamin family protein [Candidatus Magnetoovum sp. WYHC-5]|nr:dynamin family protein [Candidatus Magnetoovum sp. WYHC-5]
MADVINQKYEQFRSTLIDLLTNLLLSAKECSKCEEEQRGILKLIKNMNTPFLFVVVGEVKAGKSSFINALLNQEITKVSPDPCTDHILEIAYAKVETRQKVSDTVERIYYPFDILEKLCIVDTPGTNTIIKGHDEITERYIPQADLIIFVFSAVNPYTQSAWELLDVIKDKWERNIVFVLQQADRASYNEIVVNCKEVKQLAIARNIKEPAVFITSAKDELNGVEKSGFKEFRDFIKATVSGGRHYGAKLESAIKSAMVFTRRIKNKFIEQQLSLNKDIELKKKIQRDILNFKQTHEADINQIVDKIASIYDDLAEDITKEFGDGLNIINIFSKSIGKLYKKELSMEVWIKSLQDVFFNSLTDGINKEISDGLHTFETSLEGLVNGLKTEIDYRIKLQDTGSIDRQCREALQRVSDLLEVTDNLIVDKKITEFSEEILQAGTIAALGAIIMAATHIALIDITGGIITSIGMLFAGSVILFKRKRIINGFIKKLDEAKKDLTGHISGSLENTLGEVYTGVDLLFEEYYNLIDSTEGTLLPIIEKNMITERDLEALLNSVLKEFLNK